MLDAAPIPIGAGREQNGYVETVDLPAVSAAAEGYFVSYAVHDDTGTYGHSQLVTPDGVSSPLEELTGCDPLVVPSPDGSELFFTGPCDPSEPGTIYGQPLGSGAGTWFTISGPDEAAQHPAAAYDGARILVVWDERDWGELESATRVVGAFIDAAAGSTDGPQFQLSPPGRPASDPSVMFDGEHFLVVWREAVLAPAADLVAARVRRDGSVVDAVPFTISAGAPPELPPAIAAVPGGGIVAYARLDPRLGSTRVALRTLTAAIP